MSQLEKYDAALHRKLGVTEITKTGDRALYRSGRIGWPLEADEAGLLVDDTGYFGMVRLKSSEILPRLTFDRVVELFGKAQMARLNQTHVMSFSIQQNDLYLEADDSAEDSYPDTHQFTRSENNAVEFHSPLLLLHDCRSSSQVVVELLDLVPMPITLE